MQPIKIAILAMGGEGGGVLADWIVDMGEANGHIAQTTSVPGVAQRTGATIYYVELYPKAQALADRGEPVLALMPLQGDVDIVLASELMEAGRAVQRGFVTSDRTTLIASTHRVYSIAEKSALGDGRVDSAQLLEHARNAAKRFIRFDMAQLAQEWGSVISSVLFGALAGSGELPFNRAAFEATIERSAMGVGPSLKAFAAAFDRAQSLREDSAVVQTPETGMPAIVPLDVAPSQPRHPRVRALVERVHQQFPSASRDVLLEGVRRLIDYQDLDYATLYLDRMRDVSAVASDDAGAVARTTARHLALWMSYEDTARVADLKTRDSRFERVRTESGALSEHVLAINEYMHPRIQEICETLPAGFGRWLMKPGAARSLIERLTRRGRVIRTSSLRGYLMLRAVAGMKRWRRSTLRYAEENTRIQAWLECIIATAKRNPALAIEVAECQRLVKGYSDTHERGVRNYDLLMDAMQRAGAAISPASLHELREAALADEHGNALRAALARQSLT